MALSFLSVKDR